MTPKRWPVVLIALSAALGAGISITLLILVLHALEALRTVQAFDHAQSAHQLKEAAQGAKVIPQAIHTLENHLDKVIGHDVRAAANRIIRSR